MQLDHCGFLPTIFRYTRQFARSSENNFALSTSVYLVYKD